MDTTETTYIVGAYTTRGDRRRVISDVPTYTEALAIYQALEASTHEDIREFVVRSNNDPQWTQYLQPSLENKAPGQAARAAQREYRRRELGATVTALLNTDVPRSLGQLEQAVRKSLVARGIPAPERFAIEAAVKARVTLGRCRRDSYYGPGCGRAWYFPKKAGPLHKQRCSCGQRLHQTTLALQQSFHRLDLAEKATV